MRRKLLVGLLALNLALAGTLFGGPVATQIVPRVLMDCCKEDAGEPGQGYCCEDCCWLISDCETNDDCQDPCTNGIGR